MNNIKREKNRLEKNPPKRNTYLWLNRAVSPKILSARPRRGADSSTDYNFRKTKDEFVIENECKNLEAMIKQDKKNNKK